MSKTNININYNQRKIMKSFISSLSPLGSFRNLKTSLAIMATAALALVGASLPTTRAQASEEHRENTQVAEILQLLADFHGALSYGGNITAMMSLWTEDSSITLNGVAHNGKDAVQTFFTSGGYFVHNWVSLAPEYKTTIAIHGDTAEATTQCVAIDLTVTPMVVRSVTQVNATAVKRDGKWLFTSMNNTAPAPL